MNYDQPLQLRGTDGKPTGLWHYCTANRRAGTHPIGYCADHPGHPSEDEARACYQQYLRERVRFDIQFSGWHDCAEPGCDKPTKIGVGSGPYQVRALCHEHTTQLCAWRALGLDGEHAGDSMHS